MFTQNVNHPQPIVLAESTTKQTYLGQWIRWRLPLTWRDYCDSSDTRKKRGKFQLANDLRDFLQPYRDGINYPDNLSGAIIFFSFFIQIKKENDPIINELHLSKVVVLLQLLADPNLPMSRCKETLSFLWGTFDNSQLGLDSLHLLFSYGLNYNIFLDNIRLFIKRKTNTSLNSNSVIQFLNNTPEEKDQFIVDTKLTIYRPILDISNEKNLYIQLYQNLRMAYLSFSQTDYKQAGDFYLRSSQILEEVSETKNLSLVIKEDYQRRREYSMQYYEICSSLITNNSRIPNKKSNSVFFNNLSNPDSAETESLMKIK